MTGYTLLKAHLIVQESLYNSRKYLKIWSPNHPVEHSQLPDTYVSSSLSDSGGFSSTSVTSLSCSSALYTSFSGPGELLENYLTLDIVS